MEGENEKSGLAPKRRPGAEGKGTRVNAQVWWLPPDRPQGNIDSRQTSPVAGRSKGKKLRKASKIRSPRSLGDQFEDEKGRRHKKGRPPR